jgi:hypothetical protein
LKSQRFVISPATSTPAASFYTSALTSNVKKKARR